MGAERRSQFIEDKDKLATAYHEVRTFFPKHIPSDHELGRTRTRRVVHRRCHAVA